MPNTEPIINIVRIHRDYEWFYKNAKILHDFWDSVLYWRTNGIENHPQYTSIKEKVDKLNAAHKLETDVLDEEEFVQGLVAFRT